MAFDKHQNEGFNQELINAYWSTKTSLILVVSLLASARLIIYSQSAGRDYFSEKVALFCIDLEASRGVKIWRGITTFILHFNWF